MNRRVRPAYQEDEFVSNIRVMIADDHRLFREGIRRICEIAGDFEVVGETGNGQDAVVMACQLKPDIVLMDINMPELDGLSATRLITQKAKSVKVIILSMNQEDHYVFESVKAGAKAYLSKDIGAKELIRKIRLIHQDETLNDPDMAKKVIAEFGRLAQKVNKLEAEKLTPGEMDVLKLLAQGEDNKTIAKHLDLSEKTVANRLGDIYQKLRVNNRIQASLFALRRGWATLYKEK